MQEARLVSLPVDNQPDDSFVILSGVSKTYPPRKGANDSVVLHEDAGRIEPAC